MGKHKNVIRKDPQLIRNELVRISQMITQGKTEPEIRAALKMPRNVWRARLRRLQSYSVNTKYLWMRYETSTRQDMQVIHAAMMKSLEDGDWRTAILGAVKKAQLRRDTIEVGQSLGIYEKLPDEMLLRNDDPTLGLFFRQGQTDDQLPNGNVYNTGNDNIQDATIDADETSASGNDTGKTIH